MSVSRDPDRLIGAYLEDGIDELPDRAYDAVRSEIDHTRQRVVFGPWREDQMRRYAIFGIAAAVIVLVAVVGIRFLPSNGGFAGPPAPTPTPSPTPSQTPLLTASPTAWPSSGSGPVTAGRYYITDSHATNVTQLTFTVPDGWTNADNIAKDAGTPGEVMFTTWAVSDIFTDACKWNETSIINVGTLEPGGLFVTGTAEQFVTALAQQKSRTASAVTDTTVGDHPAKQIEMTVAPTLDTATCTDGNLRYWPDPGPDFSGGLCCNATGNIDVVTAVDLNDRVMVVIARHWPGSSSQNLAELQSIVDSIQIHP